MASKTASKTMEQVRRESIRERAKKLLSLLHIDDEIFVILSEPDFVRDYLGGTELEFLKDEMNQELLLEIMQMARDLVPVKKDADGYWYVV